jgi:hypothetical protein
MSESWLLSQLSLSTDKLCPVRDSAGLVSYLALLVIQFHMYGMELSATYMKLDHYHLLRIST